MRSLDAIIGDFFAEIKNINNHKFWDDIKGDSNLLPSTISAGSGNMIRSTSRLDRYLYEIAQYVQARNFGKTQKFTDKDIYLSLREQIGPMLLELNLDSTEAPQIEIIKKFIIETSDEIPLKAQPRDYSFGCEVFNCDVDDIFIGPVSFKTRSSWLNNKLNQGMIAGNTAVRARKKWLGTRLKKRRPSFESKVENTVIDITLDYNYVCEVCTKGFGQNSGLERSLLAARISLTGIALLLDRSETAIREFNIGYDSSLFHQHYIAFNSNGADTLFSGKSYKPGGRFVRKADWDDVVKNESDYFKLYGEIADWVLLHSNNIRHPNLMNQLAQSNFWFYEACKEKLDSVAVVKFIASMDALAKSRKLKGILKILEFRAFLAPNDLIYNDGSTVEDVLKDLYEEGRSRLIHGSTDRFRSDWSAKRTSARFLAETCLLGCIRWAAQRKVGADGDDMLRP